jgi:biopolymer transport protein ExbD
MHDSPEIFAEDGDLQTGEKEHAMAGIDVGGGGGRGRRRSINTEINMIPFIDLLLCTIAFLLITAVWVTSSRVQADAQAPGPNDRRESIEPEPETRTLHVSVREGDFLLQWKAGRTLISESSVPRSGVAVGEGSGVTSYPELKKAIADAWRQYREHSDVSDKERDRLVLHSDDRTPFRELVAVLDAAAATKRDILGHDGKLVSVPAFRSTFAVR